MRGNRKGNIKKERVIMITSSVLVLAALTMTGVYIKDKSAKVEDDGYSIDFSALENSPEEKFEEIVGLPQESLVASEEGGQASGSLDDDLDYAPKAEEVDSGLIEIQGITDGRSISSTAKDPEGMAKASEEGDTAVASANKSNKEAEEESKVKEDAVEESKTVDTSEVEANSGIVEVAKTLRFPDTIIKPSAGNVLIPFSMDGSVYFATLDQYKYSPAVVMSAEEGNPVSACADARVAYTAKNGEIGNYIVLELGDGYQAIYGQLRDIQYEGGSYVNAGDVLGFVDAPTKYYSVEGANVFFQLQKDGVSVNPEEYFAE